MERLDKSHDILALPIWFLLLTLTPTCMSGPTYIQSEMTGAWTVVQ